jgi:hypothetical protein
MQNSETDMLATEFIKQSFSVKSGAALTTLNIPLHTAEESSSVTRH